MKKNRILKLGLLALTLTLVTASLVSGTFAKYVTTASGTGTVTVAKWDVHLGEGTSGAVTALAAFDLTDTLGTGTLVNVLANRVAPGTAGSFTLAYDTLGTEVAHNVTITLDASAVLAEAALPQLKFYSDADFNIPLTGDINALSVLSTTTPIAVGGAYGTVTVYWQWPFGDPANNTIDTADGVAAANYEITANFTATQVD